MTEKEMRENTAAEFRIFAVVAVFLAAICLACFLTPKIIAWVNFRPIDADQVQSISRNGRYQLNAAEQEKFIELYNKSEYYGKERNFDTTPGATYYITFHDGSQMTVTEYESLWIIVPDPENPSDFYYVKNKALHDFMNQVYRENLSPLRGS